MTAAIAEPLRRYLDERHVRYRMLPHDVRFTSCEVASAARVPCEGFGKLVLLKVLDRPPGRLVLAVVPASSRVDLERLHEHLGFPIELASERELDRIFPLCECGAAPPLAALAAEPVTVLVDESLAGRDVIAFNAGAHDAVVEMPMEEYVRLAQPRFVSCAGPVERSHCAAGAGPGSSFALPASPSSIAPGAAGTVK